MNAQDHDLAHSVAADEPATTAPTSPPRRDPVEDADPTFTRKRPRLDDGSNSIRAMSAEGDSPASPATAPPPEQQVEMTIRSHPPSSPMHAPEDDAQAVDGAHEATSSPKPESPVLVAAVDSGSSSPPIELVDAEAEPSLGFAIQPDADMYFGEFPFATPAAPYSQIIRDLVQHFQGSNAIHDHVLQSLTTWLNGLPEPSDETTEFYELKAGFWDDFGSVVNKLIHRRVSFGEVFEDDIQTQHIFYCFFSAYARLCSFLFLADAQQLSQPRSEELYSSVLLSQKHIRLLNILMRTEKAPVFHLLHRDYNTDLREFFNMVVKDFFRHEGAQHLLELLDQIPRQVPNKAQEYYALHGSQLLTSLGWAIIGFPGANAANARADFYRHTVSFFQKYSSDIPDPTKATDANSTRDLIVSFSLMLNGLCRWDERIASELADLLLDFGEPESPTMASPAASHTVDISDYRQHSSCFPALVMNAWRFKNLRKLLVKGNMGLRVMSIASMDTALVDIWREYNQIEPAGRHPVMQYLADFLLQGQVVNYIISVDSHPQLISRSGNIVGFLVVTHRWCDAQADLIWKTIYTSTDPRVVTATMTMLRTIINLMSSSDHLYLCEKLYGLPIERYNLDILRFLRELTVRLTESPTPVDYTERGMEAHPWNVCIRVLRDTAPSRDADKNLSDLHSEAMDQFAHWTRFIPMDERQVIFRESAKYIADQSDKATGSVRVISMLISSLHPSDGTFFQENPALVDSVLEEIPAFVRQQSQVDPYPFMLQALCYRIEFLKLALCHATMIVPRKLREPILDHVIGEQAISNEARDQAWVQLIHAAKSAPNSEFFKELVASYIPNLSPQLYTHGLFDFVAGYYFPITRVDTKSDLGEQAMLQIPGADLLWPMLLLSPNGSIENRVARLLAGRYVNIVDNEKVELAEVEQSHVALVDKCMHELQAACRALSQPCTTQSSPGADAQSQDADLRNAAETRISRILLFMKLLLEFIRQKPDFNRGQRADSKVDAMDLGLPVGDAIVIRYQCGNDRSSVSMGSEHTLDDLYHRLCHATGFTKINLFARGQRLNVSEDASSRLADMNFGGQVIVQRAEGAEMLRQISVPSGAVSTFETTIMQHFDELFAWMDSGRTASQLIFDFLSCVPAPSTFADSVVRDETSTASLFPPGKVYQARFVARTLQTRLKEHTRCSTLDEQFVSKAVHHFTMALQDTNLISEEIDQLEELHLGVVLIEVLLEFLRERPSPEVSASYYTDGDTFVNRVFKMALVAMAKPELILAALNAYATILEASLHSAIVWAAFKNHSQVQHLHTSLLLKQPNTEVREQVGSKILSLCGGDLPSTSPIARAETSKFFWDLLANMIPHAVSQGQRSQQFFEVAEQVFRANDEYNRDEASLRTSLKDWGNLLIAHEHQEFVGREEVDHVVLGLTKLLLCCILSIKSFKKPINAGSLMEQAFNTFLFPQRNPSTEVPPGALPLPILESQTRQELYNLMLALGEDSSTYEVLLKLVSTVELEEREQVYAPLVVDRSAEIRSGTGYVGLHNPRAICYLNSLMTQLFMNGDFRRFMLSMDVKQPTGSQRLLCETQKLFAQMQDSFRRSADPRDFAVCVRNLDKSPIDVAVQMDADEFYNLLFDQWEGQLFLPEHKQMFRSFYGGQTLNQIKSMECEHVSERVEPFFAVQCDVQGKANLHESLQAFIQGDVMEGDNKYKCESCDGRFVDAVKRTCLKDVPDNLIFHLKRFEFDLNDFSRRKIYDHFAFEETIDISPYKADHLEDPSKPRQEDIFDLVGVLVHTGTCENGHYYSYIRERDGVDGDSAPTWIEFNDSEVSPFNPAEIADKAFGGVTDDGYNRQIKQYSAYMLFYQRRNVTRNRENQELSSTTTGGYKAPVPDTLHKEIEAANEHFLREYCLFDPVHTRFLRQCQAASRTITHGTCSEDHEQEAHAIGVILAHLSRVAWRQQNNLDVFMELLGQLRRTISSCSYCCGIALKWIAADEHALTNLLIRCCHSKIRAQARMLLIESLKSLRALDPNQYGLVSIEGDMDVDSSDTSDGVITSFIQRLRTTADDTGESIRGWDDYYTILTQVAELGSFETALLLNSGILDFCLQLFCIGKNDPFRQQHPDFSRIMDKKKAVFNRMIAFVWTLLSSTDLRLPAITKHENLDRLASLDRDSLRFPLTKSERSRLMQWDPDMSVLTFLDKILEVFDDTKGDSFYPGEIMKWMLETPDHGLCTSLYRTMREGIQMDPPYCDAYIRAALPFCEACTLPEQIASIIGRISQMVADPDRMAEDRCPNGEIVLGFYLGLLEAQNDILFALQNTHIFRAHLVSRAAVFAVPMLCHPDSWVRKNSETLFQQLFNDDEHLTDVMIEMRYRSIRHLIPEFIHKIISEKKQGQTKRVLMPILNTCRMFAEQLHELNTSELPGIQPFQDENDTALILQYHQEIESRLRMWLYEDVGTPMSALETYDQSDYGSESDDAHEILDIGE